MTDDSSVLERIEEPELPEDTPRNRARRQARAKTPRVTRGAAASPWFNVVAGRKVRVEGPAVKQPPILPAFQKPLKPIGKVSR